MVNLFFPGPERGNGVWVGLSQQRRGSLREGFPSNPEGLKQGPGNRKEWPRKKGKTRNFRRERVYFNRAWSKAGTGL